MSKVFLHLLTTLALLGLLLPSVYAHSRKSKNHLSTLSLSSARITIRNKSQFGPKFGWHSLDYVGKGYFINSSFTYLIAKAVTRNFVHLWSANIYLGRRFFKHYEVSIGAGTEYDSLLEEVYYPYGIEIARIFKAKWLRIERIFIGYNRFESNPPRQQLVGGIHFKLWNY